jgi:hypothetical protein
MAKSSGLGDNLYVGGYDLSGDIGSLGNISGGPAALDVTSIDKAGYERIGGVRDGNLGFTAFFNKATNQEHLRLSLLPTTDQILTYCRGTALGNTAACLVGKQINYDGKRGADGSLTFDSEAQANGYGLEWGRQLTAGKRTDTTATSGTGVDFGLGSSGTGPSTFGAQFYLQVFAFTGTSVTVKIQESSDNGGADAWTDVVGGSFTAATGITSQRIATAAGQTVERYLRAVTTGTFSNAVVSVVANRNDASTAF